MFAEQRKKTIIELLKVNSSVSLNELIDTFEVSETTIRRDLTELENAGELMRTHGGAILNTKSGFEPDYLQKQSEFLDEKKNIAKTVASMVDDGDTVILDSGSTTFEIAKELSDKRITLVTNSAIIVSAFLSKQTNMQIHSTGGLLRTHTKSFVGSAAEDFLRQIRPDKAFIAANGLSLSAGATTAHMSEASIKRVIMSISKKLYLVADHSKFGKEYFRVIAPVSEFDAVICDGDVPAQTVENFRRSDIKIYCGKENEK